MEPEIVFPAKSKFFLIKINVRGIDSPLGYWNHVGIFLIFWSVDKVLIKTDLL